MYLQFEGTTTEEPFILPIVSILISTVVTNTCIVGSTGDQKTAGKDKNPPGMAWHGMAWHGMAWHGTARTVHQQADDVVHEGAVSNAVVV